MLRRVPAIACSDSTCGAAGGEGEASVAALRSAVLSQDLAAVSKALGALKGPYSRMFMKFG